MKTLSSIAGLLLALATSSPGAAELLNASFDVARPFYKSYNAAFAAEWKRQIGYDENEITDDLREFRERVHPDDVARVVAAWVGEDGGARLARAAAWAGTTSGGLVDATLTGEIEAAGYRGWYVIEQDTAITDGLHRLSTGSRVRVQGAAEAIFNIIAAVTVLSPTSYTYQLRTFDDWNVTFSPALATYADGLRSGAGIARKRGRADADTAARDGFDDGDIFVDDGVFDDGLSRARRGAAVDGAGVDDVRPGRQAPRRRPAARDDEGPHRRRVHRRARHQLSPVAVVQGRLYHGLERRPVAGGQQGILDLKGLRRRQPPVIRLSPAVPTPL